MCWHDPVRIFGAQWSALCSIVLAMRDLNGLEYGRIDRIAESHVAQRGKGSHQKLDRRFGLESFNQNQGNLMLELLMEIRDTQKQMLTMKQEQLKVLKQIEENTKSLVLQKEQK